MQPKNIGKYTVLLREDYVRLCRERNQAVQTNIDMFNGKRCEVYQAQHAEIESLHRTVDHYRTMLQEDDRRFSRELEKANKQIEQISDKVRELVARILELQQEDHERRVP